METTLEHEPTRISNADYSPRICVASDYESLCDTVAQRIANLVRRKPNAVLGLATGSTPTGIYSILARMHAEEGLDFSQVRCFNLDEYYPMEPSSTHSYHRFMLENLFDRINCKEWMVPDGHRADSQSIESRSRSYEDAISNAGGIDLQLLGIGRNGHIGFNEPGSAFTSRTRLVELDEVTREDAAKGFDGHSNVPLYAITMGVATILDAREIVLLARGSGKAEIIREALYGQISTLNPATALRTHPNAWYFLDKAAAAALPRAA